MHINIFLIKYKQNNYFNLLNKKIKGFFSF